MRWFWRLRREWRQREQDARQEVDTSRRELEKSRKRTSALEEWREHNHFAVLIKDSLQLKNGEGR